MRDGLFWFIPGFTIVHPLIRSQLFTIIHPKTLNNAQQGQGEWQWRMPCCLPISQGGPARIKKDGKAWAFYSFVSWTCLKSQAFYRRVPRLLKVKHTIDITIWVESSDTRRLGNFHTPKTSRHNNDGLFRCVRGFSIQRSFGRYF